MSDVLYCPECPECGKPTIQVQYVSGQRRPHCSTCPWPLKELPKRSRRGRPRLLND